MAVKGFMPFISRFAAIGIFITTFGCNSQPASQNTASKKTKSLSQEMENDYELTFKGSIVVKEDSDVSGKVDFAQEARTEIKIVQPPVLGSLKTFDASNGNFKYVPNLNASGDDAFIYKLLDSSGKMLYGIMQISVVPENDAPIALGRQFLLKGEATLEGFMPFLDVDSPSVKIKLLELPAKGAIESVDEATGRFRYVPTPGSMGIDKFSYAVSDGEATSATAEIEIGINASAESALLVIQSGASSAVQMGTLVVGDHLEAVLTIKNEGLISATEVVVQTSDVSENILIDHVATFCSVIMIPTQSCELKLSVRPASHGNFSANVKIKYLSGEAEKSVVVIFSGDATDPVVPLPTP